MKIIKLVIISAIVLFFLLTAFASLLPSRVRISRAIDIGDSLQFVRRQLKDFHTWQLWNEYIRALPEKNVANDSIYSEKLSVSIITSNEVSIETKWRRENGRSFPGVFSLTDRGSVTTVQWYFDFSFKWYPWEKFSSIIYDKQMGPAMEKSLLNLKELLEKEQ